MTHYQKQREDIKKSIDELNEAIEVYRELNEELNKNSGYYWTEEIEKVSNLIKGMIDAKKRLKAILFALDAIQTPLIDTELLTQNIINSHNNYINWRETRRP